MDASSELKFVQVDPVVVLKIIKHCKESLPAPATGQLLGLDIDSTLEVTNCFPFPTRSTEEDEENLDADGAEYQLQMMIRLRDVNVDNNTVGWYQSTYLGSFPVENMIETQANYQDSIKKAVCLVHDPVRTSAGNLYLKAYRLTDTFLELYKTQRFTQESLAKADISSTNIFEEVAIKYHNDHLVRALTMELESDVNCDLDRLELGITLPLERSLEFVNECIDDLASEHSKFQFYQRQLARQAAQQAQYLSRRANTENGQEEDLTNNPLFKPIPEPSRLESLLITYQINTYCSQMHALGAQNLTKLFMANAVKRE